MSDSSGLPFNFFDENIPVEEISKLIAGVTHSTSSDVKPEFNILNPVVEFDWLFRQALDTSHNLIEISKDELSEKDSTSRLRYIKCFNVIHHIFGTSAALIVGKGNNYSLNEIKSFNAIFLQKIFERYEMLSVLPVEIESYVRKIFIDFILINILDKKLLNNGELNFGKWIDIYANQNFEDIKSTDELEIGILQTIMAISLEQDFADLDNNYLVQIVIQTLVWYMLSHISPRSLQRFKQKSITLKAVLDCYCEELYNKIPRET